MYASAAQRDADIATGAALPADELRARLSASAQALAADLDALPNATWTAKVITAQGLTRSRADNPWMRDREVYIHAGRPGRGHHVRRPARRVPDRPAG